MTIDDDTKRRSRRVKLDVFLNKIVDEEPFMCRATDISLDGIYLSSLIEPRFDGKEVSLEFSLPGHEEVIWARGEIVRDGFRGGASGSGIRFKVMPDQFREMIAEYIEQSEEEV